MPVGRFVEEGFGQWPAGMSSVEIKIGDKEVGVFAVFQPVERLPVAGRRFDPAAEYQF